VYLAQQEQDITGKMSQCSIPAFILAPAPLDLPPIECQSLGVPCSFGVIDGEQIPLRFGESNLFLEFVNVSARASLSSIEGAGIKEKRSANLLVMFIDCRGSE
jgi:hypothetical protein